MPYNAIHPTRFAFDMRASFNIAGVGRPPLWVAQFGVSDNGGDHKGRPYIIWEAPSLVTAKPSK
jgi:hypothetical protein